MMFLTKPIMHNLLCRNIGFVRFFRCFVTTKRDAFPVNSNATIKPAANFNYPKKSCFAILMTPFQVLKVYLPSNLSKIANPVVASITVDVVNIKIRPLSIIKKPSQPVRPNHLPIDRKGYIPILFPSKTFSIFSPFCVADSVKMTINRIVLCMESTILVFKHNASFRFSIANINTNGRV